MSLFLPSARSPGSRRDVGAEVWVWVGFLLLFARGFCTEAGTGNWVAEVGSISGCHGGFSIAGSSRCQHCANTVAAKTILPINVIFYLSKSVFIRIFSHALVNKCQVDLRVVLVSISSELPFLQRAGYELFRA